MAASPRPCHAATAARCNNRIGNNHARPEAMAASPRSCHAATAARCNSRTLQQPHRKQSEQISFSQLGHVPTAALKQWSLCLLAMPQRPLLSQVTQIYAASHLSRQQLIPYHLY
jgi:hypothetical protein